MNGWIVLAAGLPIAVLEAVLATEDAGGWYRTVYVLVLLYGFVLAAERRARVAVARVARSAGCCGLAGFVVLVWRILEWDGSACVQLVLLILGTVMVMLALYELLRWISVGAV